MRADEENGKRFCRGEVEAMSSSPEEVEEMADWRSVCREDIKEPAEYMA